MQGGLIDADHLVEVVHSVLQLRQKQFHPLLDHGRPADRRGQETPTVVKEIEQ